MDVDVARRLAGPEGEQALAAAGAETNPDSLGAATRLRSRFDADLAAAALDQTQLRRRAVTKVGPVGGTMLWTRDGLEQATRGPVSAWRARRLLAAGVRRVIDLGCSCGADARACLDAGLDVTAVEIDPATAQLARHNLPGAEIRCADATDVLDELLAAAGPEVAVLLDPARRTGRGRSWRLADLQPPWSFVTEVMGRATTIVKLGPGIPHEALPADVAVTWVGQGRDLVETTLWAGRWQPSRSAVLVGDDGEIVADLPAGTDAPPVGPPGRYLAEPHPAAIRAGCLGALRSPGLRSVDDGIAYLWADEPIESPWLTWFAVEEVLPLSERVLRAWVRDHRIGRLEVKKRGIEIDPDALRRSLRPRGPGCATIVLTPTPRGGRAVICHRVEVED